MAEYIERKEVLWLIYSGKIMTGDRAEKSATTLVNSIPAADVRPVVLCRDCKFRSNEWTGCPKLNGTITGDEFFCKCGIKKREES